jgi:hypothetical protein
MSRQISHDVRHTEGLADRGKGNCARGKQKPIGLLSDAYIRETLAALDAATSIQLPRER